ncbi:arginyl-tRNA--protein transferase 1 isoform X6 [Takifugu rubripes]|uniref:Arginyl-tRNA--protein transferase 1 n=1 Tax=Takifugu rubripes TaxID=31033 RepID=A0A674MAI8_TAKRU|nr:arginyl-tRNA--protein transferase 1 isoform X6 [Takifugu rubripes]|eukprot:XP_011601182.1 PREDICTED: arginyl-tRNA--protein transferase 1 isoform X2 [Takifugu rubripes]
MAGNMSYTIVEYFGGDEGHRCGYCKNEKSNFSHGMWSHTMTVQDYQDLIDRGWRRSGKYVYKPTMDKTCCPQYAIRCHALKFQPSKSHKKILKKMNKFISQGELPKEPHEGEPMESVSEEMGTQGLTKMCHSEISCSTSTNFQKEVEVRPTITEFRNQVTDIVPTSSETVRKDPKPIQDERAAATAPKPGAGADANRPPCRKAKELRKERRLQKEQERHNADAVVSSLSHAPTQTNQPKPLEDFISESLMNNSAHRLEVRLVPVSFEDPQFMASYQQSVVLFARYQKAIHGDDPNECSETEFRRFLCDSPLEAEYSVDGPTMGYGSFHQQYWLDGQIVAVGVIDILPTCVSSVYLFYHPDFASLSLGSYSALREIAFTRQLQIQSSKLSYYYLGFYIHSCPKMRYKGQYRPSDLLCPETFVWVPIEQCTPHLDNARYARFNQDPDAGDACVLTDLGRALVLYKRGLMPYAVYSRKRKGCSDEDEMQQYASLVGQNCVERILLYRS